MGVEIERKFLLSKFPDRKPIVHKSAETVYLKVDRDGLDIKEEIRVRKLRNLWPKKSESYRISFKSGGDLSRVEIETDCDKKFFEEIKVYKQKVVYYDVYFYNYEGYLIETAKVDDEFVYAEVEFKSEEEAKAFEWPWKDCLIKEITYDKHYKMANYYEDRL